MNKRELLKISSILASPLIITMAKNDIPVIETRGHYSRYDVEIYKYNIYIKAKVFDTVKGSILKVALFNRKDLVKDIRTPSYEIYISNTENTFVTWDKQKEKWRESMIDKLAFEYSYEENRKFCDKHSEKQIVDYLKGKKKTAYAGIHEFQVNVRKNNLLRIHRSITERIDQKMELVPKIPSDIEYFIDEKALIKSRYIIYEYSRKITEGYCTHCKRIVPVDNPKHLKEGVCTKCHSKIIYIAKKKSATIRDEVETSILQKTKEGFVLRYFDCIKTYSKGKLESPKLYYYEYKRKFYNQFFYCEDDYYWEEFKSTGIIRWCDSSNAYGYNSSYRATLYTRNLTRDLKGSDMQYSGIDLLAKKGIPIYAEKYITRYRSEKYLEYLVKVGMTNLALDVINNYGHFDEINPYQKKLKDILVVSKENLELLKKINGGITELRILKKSQEKNIRLSTDQVAWIAEHYSWGEILNYTRYSTVHKLIKYANTLDKNEKRDYLDYLKWCQELEYDLNNEFILYPKPFKQAHDKIYEENQYLKDKKKAAELRKESVIIKKKAPETERQFGLETNELIIVVPKSAGDIIKEGHALHHCVGGYVKNVANGNTNILFIRQKENIKKAFYTMEVNNGKIIQVRGINNCNMTDEVEAFTKLFKRKRLKEEKVAS